MLRYNTETGKQEEVSPEEVQKNPSKWSLMPVTTGTKNTIPDKKAVK
jgi:hypothetical protein